MSNENDDWGNPPGNWGEPEPQQQPDESWGQAPAPGPGAPQAQQAPPAGQTPHQAGGVDPSGPAQHDIVHQKKGGADKLETNDFIAMAVNFFIPGVGHLMLGQTTRGIALLAAFVFTCNGLGLLPFLALADAYFVALTRKYRDVGDWEFFPDYKEHI